ncbi:allophanate hydrolase [Paenibacillus athensensis]|uniref:Allophanate hydrolase n=1 Tax=Paenibacillus athensensis TaxID=1967502 RepID=A0A4Y8Q0A8_9BACL|nr:allophanate hydrolase [Paenibacillus athensensis]MCD1258556.1 allophanate hydrolase [Paenibacillus athensensis]
MGGAAGQVPSSLSIAALREAYRSRGLTPEAVVRSIVERAEAEADKHIWITPPSMERLRPYLVRLEERGLEELPLWGIPFAVKDNIDVAGMPTTAACPDYQYMPGGHATAVERLVAAGAIPLGKTNLDQFAAGLVGVRSPYGETHNALRPELISGGSSSGSAVAVARGQAVFALGTDTAGSGRVPAALNGLIGFKPRLGAWPTKGVVPACASLDCVTVFARELADVREVDRIVRGRDRADPWSAGFEPPGARLPRKVLLPREPLAFFGLFEREYAAAWAQAVERLDQLGMEVVFVDTALFERVASLLYDGPFVEERWAAVGDFIEAHPGSALPVTERILRTGPSRQYSASALFKAIHAVRHDRREAWELLEDAVLALPTVGGTWTRERVRAKPVEANSALGRYTNHCNLLDLCAIALPAGEAAADVPFGITLFASAEHEALLYGAAAAFLGAPQPTVEAACPQPGRTLVAVCGLHMRGYPLERQMLGCGARFVREDRTAAVYRLFKLETIPPKPGLVRQAGPGASIALEIWEMPTAAFGDFVAAIPAPLGIGKIELQDGSQVPGFVCEAWVAAEAEDITATGGWRAAVEITRA